MLKKLAGPLAATLIGFGCGYLAAPHEKQTSFPVPIIRTNVSHVTTYTVVAPTDARLVTRVLAIPRDHDKVHRAWLKNLYVSGQVPRCDGVPR